jgi:hypothetical protein
MIPELRALGFFTIGHMHVRVFRGFFYTVSYRYLKRSMRFSWVKLYFKFVFPHRDHYGSGVTCTWIFYYRTYWCNSFPGFFSTLSYRNLKLSMRFFWVKLHIDFVFPRRDHFGSGVTCPWMFYCRTYACGSFPGVSSTLFHIGTWNFPWGFLEF